MQVGLVVWHASSGAWLRESKVYTKTATWLVIFPALYAVGSILAMYYRRPIVEDEMLKKEFGKKWDEWAKKVPYRLVPGIY
jgi:protein-S-isoprenylcysteine O-methyltransferase Ste14